jgi:Ca-dependent carbohydrate-binding module xylan-binding
MSTLTGDTNFHLTAQPTTDPSATPAQLLARITSVMSYFAVHQAANGSLPDQFNGVIQANTGGAFAYGGALLASTGNTTFLAASINAMNYSAAAYATGSGAPEFDLPPLVSAYTIFKNSGLATTAELTTWAQDLSGFHYTASQLDSNWSTYAMNGAWQQYEAGLVSHATAVGEIESIWTQYQQPLITGSDGLYQDPGPPPTSLSVEAVGRGNLTELVAAGYDGPSAGAMSAAIEQGGQTSLLLTNADGEVPAGGRTDDHVWVDAGYQAIDQTLAKLNATSNPALAAQYQTNADLLFNDIAPYAQSDGSYSVTKNQYPATAAVGFQNASTISGYNADLLSFTADAYQALINTPTLPNVPDKVQIGGFVYTTPATFDTTVAAAGGTNLEIETSGRSTTLNGNQTWNALGVDRIGAVGLDARLGPADGVYSASTGLGVTFAPEWNNNGTWTRLSEHPGNYFGTVTTQVASPVLTILTVVWSGGSGNPTFNQKLTITPDGVLSQTTESGSSDAFGMTLPLLHFDGRTTLNQTISGSLASVSYPGGTSSENFLALDPGATLTANPDLLTTYGEVTPVSARSTSATQDIFVLPLTSGDPSATTVDSSFALNSGGYTSDLGWVSGTLYSGRTSAGGFGSSIAISGGGTPDVTFSKAVNFILQMSQGNVTAVEADQAVSVTLGGQTHTLSANTPLTGLDVRTAGFNGSSAPVTPPTVTIGSGPDTLALEVSEDAYLGNAQFTVFVDGHQIGGTQTTTALQGAGQTQTFNVLGTFAAGSHTATVNFLNDAYGGSPSTDRNLYVDGATIDGSVVSGATLSERKPGPQSFSFQAPGTSGPVTPPPVTIGSGPDTLALKVSEDAYLGDAQFTVSVDGHQIGGTQTTTASHAAGQTQTFNVLGTFAAGSHTATVNFLNDAYGGSPSADRNLYVDGATIDGSVVSGATLTEHFQGPQSFSFLAPGTSGPGSTVDTVTVNRPAPLIAGLQTITGMESDPSQSIFLDWRTYGTPVLGDGDWVQATVTPSGSFSAPVTIDHPGTQSTMYYRIGSGPTITAWSATPS